MSSICQSDHLGRLLGQCQHRMRMVMDRSLRQYGVTPVQCRALMYLHRQPEPVTQRQLEQWAARYGYRDRPGEMLEHVKKGHGSRYTCVNLTNADTIEFRMFRGTLKLNTLIATLQLVDHICDAAIFMSDDELHDLSWSSFVSAIKEPELVQYLKERNLYINEPVEVEGEV